MKTGLSRTFLIGVIFSLMSFTASAADVVLTPFGQSPDAMMVKVVMKKLGVDGRLEKVLKAEDLQGALVLGERLGRQAEVIREQAGEDLDLGRLDGAGRQPARALCVQCRADGESLCRLPL